MLKNFLIVAWRNILRHKGYAIIHVIGLGVGICACLGIWSITHYELSFDKFHPDRERIYRAYMELGQNDGSHAMWGDIPEPAEPALLSCGAVVGGGEEIFWAYGRGGCPWPDHNI